MYLRLFEIELIPFQPHQLRYPQAMPVGDQDQRSVPEAMPTYLTGRFHQCINLIGQQVLTTSHISILRSARARRRCSRCSSGRG